jgi:hypothetical protein
MIYRKMDANGDYVLSGTGNDYYANSAAGVAQAIVAGLALFQGEWFIDTSQGMPWRTEVLGKYTANAYDSVIKDQILGTVGVQSITAYSSGATGRALSVNVTVQSIFGPVTVATTI